MENIRYHWFMKFLRKPDVIIGDVEDPYLVRWWVIPRNKFFNIYLHLFMKSDEDRALHDHPWYSLSFILTNGYKEVWQLVKPVYASGLLAWNKTFERKPFQFIFRKADQAHRIILYDNNINGVVSPKPTWSLFLTGPVIRKWGFYCPNKWVLWTDFVAPTEEGNKVGKGCD